MLAGVSKLLASNNREALQQLVAWNQLLRRMANMDGITVLDSCGAIIGYNCFVKDSTAGSHESGTITGGARRRAFDVLRSQIGKQISGVIYKSQDGVVELGISSHDV